MQSNVFFKVGIDEWSKKERTQQWKRPDPTSRMQRNHTNPNMRLQLLATGNMEGNVQSREVYKGAGCRS